jgi:hypothetical protein
MPGRAVRGSANPGRAFVAALIAAAFGWALVLSVLPQLHERVHSDANQSNHECAITLVAAGNYHHAATGPLIAVPAPAIQFSDLATLNSSWVPSLFLRASIFEHAPPACA